MAELYLAKASGIEGFEKLVVLKRILPQHAASEDFVAMFLAEARLAASLHHPNIAQTYDIGEVKGSYFFTMEYVHGEDLRQLKRALGTEGRMPMECAIAVALGLAAGLHHAHEKRGPDGQALGLVHRDVSPSNVIVSYDGGVKLVDFGIAKATALKVDTRAGTLKGKISYMSPEQCKGEPLDRRSDVYAIGILLWEMATGQRLYQGDNEFAILTKIVSGETPPPSSVAPGFAEELERIILRALASERDERYATALELQAELEEYARHARLNTSALRLSRMMEELFGPKQDPWTATPTAPVDDRSGGSMVAAESRAAGRTRRWGWGTLAGVGAAIGVVGVAVGILVGAAGERETGDRRPETGNRKPGSYGEASAAAVAAAPEVGAGAGAAAGAGAGTAPAPEAAPAPAPPPAPAPALAPAPKAALTRSAPPRAPARSRTRPPVVSPTPSPKTEKPPAWDPDSPLPPPSR
jgi:protein kinase-like protein